jgi:hypothetical protein
VDDPDEEGPASQPWWVDVIVTRHALLVLDVGMGMDMRDITVAVGMDVHPIPDQAPDHVRAQNNQHDANRQFEPARHLLRDHSLEREDDRSDGEQG